MEKFLINSNQLLKMNIVDELWQCWNPRQKSDQILKDAINEVVQKCS